jgi:hypothetical protein
VAKKFRGWVKVLLVAVALFPWSIFVGIPFLTPWLPSWSTVKMVGLGLFIWFIVSCIFCLVFWPALAQGLRGESDRP